MVSVDCQEPDDRPDREGLVRDKAACGFNRLTVELQKVARQYSDIGTGTSARNNRVGRKSFNWCSCGRNKPIERTK